MIRVLHALLWLAAAFPALASDQAREQAFADEIVDFLVVGDPVWLEADGRRFLGLYTEAGEAGDAVLLMHGRGVHPNWPQVIFPLRDGLPATGWATLSIQMPIAGREAPMNDYLDLLPEVPGRIDAALSWLRAQGHERIVLVGHSLGAAMGAYYFADAPDADVAGFVAIGLSPFDEPQLRIMDVLGQIGIPLLDVYGGADFDEVRDSAAERAAAASNTARFEQIEVADADHYFTDHAPELRDAVRQWLDTLPENR
jgi:pimeloyl-ACP methyl ester carboxylesterase